jgi:hypothetical protein
MRRPCGIPRPRTAPTFAPLPILMSLPVKELSPLEILADAPDLDTLLVAVVGGGLISGIAIAAKAVKPGIRVIGVEPTGAPTLHRSLAASRLVELASLETAAVTLAPLRSAAVNLAIIEQNVERIVLVEDREMREAARWLWREARIAAELSSAAAVAALLAGHYRPAPDERAARSVAEPALTASVKVAFDERRTLPDDDQRLTGGRAASRLAACPLAASDNRRAGRGAPRRAAALRELPAFPTTCDTRRAASAGENRGRSMRRR